MSECAARSMRRPPNIPSFGITEESWLRWRDGGRGTYSGGTKRWTFPRLTELRYPTRIKTVSGISDTTRSRHPWVITFRDLDFSSATLEMILAHTEQADIGPDAHLRNCHYAISPPPAGTLR
jgi:hypothetical protein